MIHPNAALSVEDVEGMPDQLRMEPCRAHDVHAMHNS